MIRPPRDHVQLPTQRRDPERVDHVRARQIELDRLPHRQADLVVRPKRTPVRQPIGHPPPPHFSDHVHRQTPLRRPRQQPRQHRQPVGQQGSQDHRRKHHPAPDNPTHRHPRIVLPGSHEDRVDRQPDHDHPDHRTPADHPPKQPRNLRRRLTPRIQRRLIAENCVSGWGSLKNPVNPANHAESRLVSSDHLRLPAHEAAARQRESPGQLRSRRDSNPPIRHELRPLRPSHEAALRA